MSNRPLLMAASVSVLLAGIAALPQATSAEMAFSVYGGYQGAAKSDVDINHHKAFEATWDGKSFTSPPYWGVRGTWWLDQFGYSNLGVELDFSHSKVYASDGTLAKAGWSHFEYSDGINILTLNAMYRFPIKDSRWTPYAGVGAGINVPHVEVTRPSGRTFNYQFGGPTLQAQAGIQYDISKHWAVFAEYKGNYSWVDVDIDSGDKLRSNLFTNALNFGVSVKF